VSRKQVLTLCAVSDLVLALVLSVVGHVTGQVALGIIALVLMIGAVGILVFARQS